jgi:hypothetical protein
VTLLAPCENCGVREREGVVHRCAGTWHRVPESALSMVTCREIVETRASCTIERWHTREGASCVRVDADGAWVLTLEIDHWDGPMTRPTWIEAAEPDPCSGPWPDFPPQSDAARELDERIYHARGRVDEWPMRGSLYASIRI